MPTGAVHGLPAGAPADRPPSRYADPGKRRPFSLSILQGRAAAQHQQRADCTACAALGPQAFSRDQHLSARSGSGCLGSELPALAQCQSRGRDWQRSETSQQQAGQAAPLCCSRLLQPLAHTLSAAPPAGPGTYTLPRLMGPNTACTSASPCYSMRGRSQRGRFDEDLAKVSPAAPLFRVSIRSWAALPVPQGLPSPKRLCLTQASRERESLECDPSPVRP